MSLTERGCTAGIIAGALLLILWERWRPYNRGQRIFRAGWFDDLALYTLAQSYVIGIVIFSGLIRWMDSATGLTRLQLMAGWPFLAQLAFFTVSHDLYIYWMHRWMHRNRFLWRLHEAHHSPQEVDWLSGARSHALEILLNQTIEFAPIVLLGASSDMIAWKGLVSAVWGMYIHANVDSKLGPLRFIVNGPEMHRWHHTTGRGRSRNFATKFAVWDWMFGTAWAPGEAATHYGLRSFFPAHYVAQILYAFRPFRRAAREMARTAHK